MGQRLSTLLDTRESVHPLYQSADQAKHIEGRRYVFTLLPSVHGVQYKLL